MSPHLLVAAALAASPEGASPEGASPEGASPEGASPEGASPEGASPEGASPEGAELRLTLVEVPDVAHGYPSFGVAVDTAVAVDRLAVLGVQHAAYAAFPERPGLRKGLGMGASGALGFGLVYVGAWAHEEAHRAVMANRGVSSRNGLYHPEAWSNGLISVDHVSDADLSALKAEHPADTVRLMSAGLEAQHLVVRRTGDAAFFGDEVGGSLGPLYLGDTWMFPSMLATEASILLYQLQCADSGNDALTDEETRLRTEEADRDFTGLDCVAWVYDMRRPDEPYDARGPHPYGEGVDRYRSWSDLTADEQGWLERQFLLSLLDLVDPHLYGIDGVRFSRGRWLASLGYMPTPWGAQLDVRGRLRTERWKLAVDLHNGLAEAGWFPGVDVAVVDRVIGPRLTMDAGLGGWLQPEDQRWDGARAPGGHAWADVRWRVVDALDVEAGVEGKSAGFVAGNVHLDPAVVGRVGVRVRVR